MKYKQLNDLVEGDEITQVFLLADVKRGTTKSGKPYGNITLRDRSGQLSVKLWDFDPGDYQDFRAGVYIKLTIEVETFRGARQGKSRSAPMIVPEPEDTSVYESARSLDKAAAEAYYDKLMTWKDKVKNPYIKTYLDTMFDNDGTRSLFITAPASVTNRGAYRGGLVEHVYKVMLNAIAIVNSQVEAANPTPIDLDVIIAGVLMHDVGKMFAYTVDHSGPHFTRSGRLLEHLPMSYALSVQTFIQAESVLRKEIPEEIKDHINHCILAHHGQLDYGSPVRPQSLEAQIIHVADLADSTSSNYAEPSLDNAQHVTEDGFVQGSYFASRNIYIGRKNDK